jgi:hypothetical protein
VREHHAALSALQATLRSVPADAWLRPRAEGKWSPAEVADHLALVYRVMLAELDGAPAIPRRAGPAATRILRWVVLPHILFHRSIPVRVKAPREVRPRRDLPGPEETACSLAELGSRLEARLAADGDARITHPYFGSLDAATALRFCAAHMEHHHRQITRAGSHHPPPDQRS